MWLEHLLFGVRHLATLAACFFKRYAGEPAGPLRNAHYGSKGSPYSRRPHEREEAGRPFPKLVDILREKTQEVKRKKGKESVILKVLGTTISREEVTKGERGMPGLLWAKKDAASCENLRGSANGKRSASVRMGEPVRLKV